MSETLLVNRKDFHDVKIASQEQGTLEDGHVRVDIGPFALTANNITYMAVGDLIGYWKFFDPAAYGIDEPDMGRMPVWGYGRVTESKCEGAPPPKNKTGAPPSMFFAPDRAKQRIADWGGAGFAKNLAAIWLPFCESAKDWLEITNEQGETALLKCYNDFLVGGASPSQGKLFTL